LLIYIGENSSELSYLRERLVCLIAFLTHFLALHHSVCLARMIHFIHILQVILALFHNYFDHLSYRIELSSLKAQSTELFLQNPKKMLLAIIVALHQIFQDQQC